MLSRLFPVQQRAEIAPGWGVWPGDGVASTAGPEVNQSSALQLLAVAGCVRLITDAISTLPVDVRRHLPDGSDLEVAKPAWLMQPTVNLDFTGWCSQVLTSLLLHGNAYVMVLRNASGQIVELMPLDPRSVDVARVAGRKTYKINAVPYAGEMLHLTGLMLAGSDIGLSPLEYARQSIGLGLAAQSQGAEQLKDGMNMPGVIEMPGDANPSTLADMATAWKRARRNKGLPGVLKGGATWKPTGVTNEQAQFLQTRQWTAAEIAAQVYLVDPSDLGIGVQGSSLTYANLEQRNVRRLQVTLLPWITRIESAITSLLPQPRYCKLNTSALLRADSAQRWNQYAQAMTINTQAGALGMEPVLTTTEMRDLEDLDITGVA